MKTAIPFALLLAGCFDSLVSDPCKSGYSYESGVCVAANGTGPDGGTSGSGDGGNHIFIDGGIGLLPDALVCTLPELDCHGTCIDVTSDPNNCGACDHVCASGICENSHCVGSPYGHIVGIGHDYVAYHPSMTRVLANSVALARPHDVGVAFYRGTATATSNAGTVYGMTNSLQGLGRPWHPVAIAGDQPSLVGADVFVIEAQTGNGATAEAAGALWKPAIDELLSRAGVVIVLEGSSGVSYRFATGAGLYTIAAPVDATNQLALVVDATDAVADQVVSPYLAETSSVTLPGAPPPAVVATPMGATVVFHTTR